MSVVALPQRSYPSMGSTCGWLKGFTPLQVPLANGQNMHTGAFQPILVGFLSFSTKSKN
jgi:hypothetical protein